MSYSIFDGPPTMMSDGESVELRLEIGLLGIPASLIKTTVGGEGSLGGMAILVGISTSPGGARGANSPISGCFNRCRITRSAMTAVKYNALVLSTHFKFSRSSG